MLKILAVFVIVCIALAGPKVGARAGYYGTTNPFTGQETNGPALGGQLVLPLAGIFDLEFSGTYASSKADIVMSDYLVNYVNENYGLDFSNDPSGLQQYLQSKFGWSDPGLLNETYQATYHDVGLASVLKLGIPLGGSPLKPYVGGVSAFTSQQATRTQCWPPSRPRPRDRPTSTRTTTFTRRCLASSA
jgi:hypothetical protein